MSIFLPGGLPQGAHHSGIACCALPGDMTLLRKWEGSANSNHCNEGDQLHPRSLQLSLISAASGCSAGRTLGQRSELSFYLSLQSLLFLQLTLRWSAAWSLPRWSRLWSVRQKWSGSTCRRSFGRCHGVVQVSDREMREPLRESSRALHPARKEGEAQFLSMIDPPVKFGISRNGENYSQTHWIWVSINHDSWCRIHTIWIRNTNSLRYDG